MYERRIGKKKLRGTLKNAILFHFDNSWCCRVSNINQESFVCNLRGHIFFKQTLLTNKKWYWHGIIFKLLLNFILDYL